MSQPSYKVIDEEMGPEKLSNFPRDIQQGNNRVRFFECSLPPESQILTTKLNQISFDFRVYVQIM